MLVMTSGPGVGKITIVKTILRILAAKGVMLLRSDDYPFSCGGFHIMTMPSPAFTSDKRLTIGDTIA